MDATLITASLLMGISGAPHCAAMCGAPCGAIAGRATAPMLTLQVGRLLGYAAAGAFAAASVASLGTLGAAAPVLRPFWLLVQAAALVFGLWLAWTGKAPSWPWRSAPQTSRLGSAVPIRVFHRLPATARAGLAGAGWVAMPCGLLQSALLVSALASGPAQGAIVMAAFATTSALGLWLGPHLWMRLNRGDAGRLAGAASRLSGLLLAGSSAFALWHGLGAALCATPS